MGRHRRLPAICREQGHVWKHDPTADRCYEECARRNCDERRVIVPPSLVSESR